MGDGMPARFISFVVKDKIAVRLEDETVAISGIGKLLAWTEGLISSK